MTSAPTCICCGRPMADGAFACLRCGIARPAEQLTQISDMVPAARSVAYGQTRRGGGGGSGKPGSRSPGNDDAIQRLDEVQNSLTGWVRHVIEERGAQPLLVPSGGDQIAIAARWLPAHLEWLRHRQEVSEALEDIHQAVRKVGGIVNGREPGRYAGPCGYVDEDDQLCGQDVEARPGANHATCKACGSRYDVDERQAWMRGEIEGYLARPVEIAGVLLRLGFPIGYSTIAAYAAKGQLIGHGIDDEGRPLYRIGDVIDLRVGAKRGRQAHA